MITNVYALYDIKSDTFGVPFFAPSSGVAVRMFRDLANSRDTTVGRYPADFKLVHIGQFDDNTGTLLPGDNVSLGFAADFLDTVSPPVSLPSKGVPVSKA